MAKTKVKSFSKRLTRKIILWLLLLIGIMWAIVCTLTISYVKELYTFSYYNSMRSTTEYIRRVLSDVYVAVKNNSYNIEQMLDQPEQLEEVMKRIVEGNSRIRSCGISFIENYYPEKGRMFCPYAWRTSSKKEEVTSMIMGDNDQDYLTSEWFNEAVALDSGYWANPFFDGYDSTTPLVAYLYPIHDKQGRVVAIIGADVSLDWLTKKLSEEDAENNKAQFIEEDEQDGYEHSFSYTFIVSRDGTYITHPDDKRIVKDNLFNHLKAETEEDSLTIDSLRYAFATGKKDISYDDDFSPDVKNDERKSRLLFMPIKKTDWVIVTDVNRAVLLLPGILLLVVQLILTFPILLIIYFVCRHTIKHSTRPLRKLAQSADEIAKGNFLNAKLPRLYYHDEIHQLRDSFENMQQSLVRYINDLKVSTAQKSAIENELKIANAIQMAMLPTKYPNRDDIDVFGFLKPAKAVGGDLFDFFIRDNQLFFCIGDVSGKGIPAALVMAVTRSLFRNVSEHTNDPRLIVTALNDASLIDGNETNMFATFFVGVLHLDTCLLEYCNAGHDAPMLLADDVSQLPVESNLPLGVMPGWEFVAQHVNLHPGTSIFLYTDGLNEAENAAHQQFGLSRATEVAQQCISHQTFTSNELIEQMTTAVHEFVGEAEQSDDLTMLAIKIK